MKEKGPVKSATQQTEKTDSNLFVNPPWPQSELTLSEVPLDEENYPSQPKKRLSKNHLKESKKVMKTVNSEKMPRKKGTKSTVTKSDNDHFPKEDTTKSFLINDESMVITNTEDFPLSTPENQIPPMQTSLASNETASDLYDKNYEQLGKVHDRSFGDDNFDPKEVGMGEESSKWTNVAMIGAAVFVLLGLAGIGFICFVRSG